MRDLGGFFKKINTARFDVYGRNLIFMALSDFDGGRQMKRLGKLFEHWDSIDEQDSRKDAEEEKTKCATLSVAVAFSIVVTGILCAFA